MKKTILFSFILFLSVFAIGQEQADTENTYANSADNLLQNNSKLLVGGYGEVHFNKVLDGDLHTNSKLDVHRMVMLFGYNFSNKTQFITELEFEHVKEVYVEQAFLQHKINKYMNLRAGLLLVPMGIINEYHEPTTFNGVERPTVDKYITPTTWREIGIGLTGNILPASLKYQAYIMNGFNGYNGSANLNGKSGLRGGRQKGAESYMSTPNFAGKVEYYGIRGLNIGLSGYMGKTQSTLFDGIDKDDDLATGMADSSVVGISMVGLDARFQRKALQLRGQFYIANLSNTDEYNEFNADADGNPNDLGSSLIGYYAEAAYDVLSFFEADTKLYPFVRYEFLNTHHDVESNIEANPAFEKTIITTGLTWALENGACLKADIQFSKAESADDYTKTLNLGVGVMF